MATQVRVNPSEETIGLGELSVRFLLTGADTNGSASVFEVDIPAGERLKAPTHMNDEYEETIYGISGVVTWTIGGVPTEVAPGQAVCIPRGVSHRFDNLGEVAAKQLVVTTPAIMGPGYFHDVLDALTQAAGGPPSVPAMIALFKRHGMAIAPPDQQ